MIGLSNGGKNMFTCNRVLAAVAVSLMHDRGAGAMSARWAYQGRSIVVTYSREGGHISNGWVVL